MIGIMCLITISLVVAAISYMYLYSKRGMGNDFLYSINFGGSGKIKILNGAIPKEIPQEMTYYKVLYEDRNEEFYSTDLKPQDHLPSEEKAIVIAERHIESHGGLPEDAVLENVQPQYMQERAIGKEKGENIPLFVEVTYKRVINGTPVVGPGDFILVTINGSGEILSYLKTWRALEEGGKVELITVEEAIAELEKGNTIETPVNPYEYPIVIDKIYLGYYSKPLGEKQEFYKPVWVFEGKEEHHQDGEVRLIVAAFK